MQNRRSISRHERSRINGSSIATNSQRARYLGRQCDDVQRLAGQRILKLSGIEDPDIGATAPGCRQGGGGKTRAILSPICSGDESPSATVTGEHDISWFIANLQRTQHARRPIEANHTDRIGEMIDDPQFVRRSLGNRNRLESDADAAEQTE